MHTVASLFNMVDLSPLLVGGPAAMPSWLGAEALGVAVAILAAGAIALWGWIKYRMLRAPGNGAGSSRGRTAEPSAEPDPVDSPSRPVSDTGQLRALDSEPDLAPQKILFAPSVDLPSRQCPDCERTFPGVFDVCPFDSAPLQQVSSSASGDDSRRLSRQTCPECERRFELTAQYCYHDGHQLERDTVEGAQDAAAFHICRQCGWEHHAEADRARCPRDGHPLITLEPDQRAPLAPPVPFNRCRRCGHIGASNETVCPVDGSLLLPEFDVRLTALPPTGHGTRRRGCPECGTQFGDQCSFCSYDGTPLIALN